MRGLIFIAFGILYLMKPDLFRGGIFQKTSVAATTKTPEEYRRYMQVLAVILIALGISLLLYDNWAYLQTSTPDPSLAFQTSK